MPGFSTSRVDGTCAWAAAEAAKARLKANPEAALRNADVSIMSFFSLRYQAEPQTIRKQILREAMRFLRNLPWLSFKTRACASCALIHTHACFALKIARSLSAR